MRSSIVLVSWLASASDPRRSTASLLHLSGDLRQLWTTRYHSCIATINSSRSGGVRSRDGSVEEGVVSTGDVSCDAVESETVIAGPVVDVATAVVAALVAAVDVLPVDDVDIEVAGALVPGSVLSAESPSLLQPYNPASSSATRSVRAISATRFRLIRPGHTPSSQRPRLGRRAGGARASRWRQRAGPPGRAGRRQGSTPARTGRELRRG